VIFNEAIKMQVSFNITILFILVFSFCGFGQVASSSPSSDGKPQEIVQSEARFNQIAAEVGDHIKKGLFHLQDNRRSDAREEFD